MQILRKSLSKFKFLDVMIRVITGRLVHAQTRPEPEYKPETGPKTNLKPKSRPPKKRKLS